jgi:hypothetical protein
LTQYLYGRIVKLRIYATAIDGSDEISYDTGYTEFSSVQGDGSPGFRIKGKAIEFVPTVQFQTNPINVQIHNLAAASRAIIESKVGTKIEILAGYNGMPKRICIGNILWARTHKDGADYITEIVAGDSHFALVNAAINISLSGQVSYQQVVDALFTALEPVDVVPGTVMIPSGGYKNGIVLTRSPLVELSDVCRTMGRTMSLVGGEVDILPPGQDSGLSVLDVSEDTGLIGIPELNPPGQLGFVPQNAIQVNPNLDVSFTHLLKPEIVLNRMINLKSKFINGQYVIMHNEYDFDSWSGPFYNRCQAHKAYPLGGT